MINTIKENLKLHGIELKNSKLYDSNVCIGYYGETNNKYYLEIYRNIWSYFSNIDNLISLFENNLYSLYIEFIDQNSNFPSLKNLKIEELCCNFLYSVKITSHPVKQMCENIFDINLKVLEIYSHAKLYPKLCKELKLYRDITNCRVCIY